MRKLRVCPHFIKEARLCAGLPARISCNRRQDVSERNHSLTPAAIKYLLAVSELCRGGRGARSVDVAAKLCVSKPSTHHMLQALCDSGLAERERYGAIYLTEQGRQSAALYAAGYDSIRTQLQRSLGLEDPACRSAAFAVLEQVPDQIPELIERLKEA